MRLTPRLLLFVATLAVAAPAAAQEPLRPRLSEARLWAPLPMRTTPAQTLPSLFAPSVPSGGWSGAFLAGYLAGGLAGLRIGDTAAPSGTVGLWARGWYEGVGISSDPSRLGVGPRIDWSSPAPQIFYRDPTPLMDGLVGGLLGALSLTRGRDGR